MKKSLRNDLGSVKSYQANQNSKGINSKAGSTKSGKISKYFTPITSDDFDSPYKDHLTEQKPILNDSASEDSEFKTPKVIRPRSKPKVIKGAPKNARKVTKGKARQTTLPKMIKDQLPFTDSNPEDLQLAILLSESEQLAESSAQETSTQTKILNIKSTLEKFCFKSNKQVADRNFESTRRPKNSKYRYINPVLFLRAEVDRQAIIAKKISSITSQSTQPLANKTNSIYFLSSPHLQKIQHFGTNYFHRNNEYDDGRSKSQFYVKDLNIEESDVICGSLLKDWASIPGRERSPLRDGKTNSPTKNNSSQNNETSATCISPDLFDSDDEYDSKILHDSTRTSLETIIHSKKLEERECFGGIEYFESFRDDVEILSMSLTRRYNEKSEPSEEDSDISSNFKNYDKQGSISGDKMKRLDVSTSPEEVERNRSCIGTESNESIVEYGRRDISIEFTQTENSSVEITSNKEEYGLQNSSSDDSMTGDGIKDNIGYLDHSNDGNCENNGEDSFRNLNITDYIQHMLTQGSNITNSSNKLAEVLDLAQSSDESTNVDEIKPGAKEEVDFLHDSFQDLMSKPLEIEKQNITQDYSPKKFKKSISFDYYKTEIVKPTPKKMIRKSLTFSSPGDNSFKEIESSTSPEPLINDEELNYSSLFSTPRRKTDDNRKNNREDSFPNLNITEYTQNMLTEASNITNSSNKLAEVHDLTQSSDESTTADEINLRAKEKTEESNTPPVPLINDEELNYSSRLSTPCRKNDVEKNTVVIDENPTENKTLVHHRIRDLTESHLLRTPKSSTKNDGQGLSTPEGVLIKTRNVTPMPDYDRMNTPTILGELGKIGVKSLKRHRGVQILKHIYDATHPVVEEGGNGDDETVIKRRKSEQSSSRRLVNGDTRSDDTTWQAKEGHLDIVGSFSESEDLLFERRQLSKISSCAVPLHIAWHNFMACNPEIMENILLYEPLQLEVLYAMLKEQGHKYHIQDLLTFLDKKCITIRINQNSNQNKKRKTVKNKCN